MKKIFFLFTILLYIFQYGSCKLIIFQYKNNNIGNYLKYFGLIDNDIKILYHNFTINDFELITQDADGFIYPGGSSSMYNFKSKYWKYVNLTFKKNKPIMAICNGFHHVLKKLNINHPYKICNIKTNLIINNKIHNHKWCTSMPPENCDNYTIFKYRDKTYLETFSNHRIYATVYHPEKIMQCNSQINNCKKLSRISYADLIKFFNLLNK